MLRAGVSGWYLLLRRWLNKFDFGSARGIAVSRLGPNGLKIKKETTHDVV